jgi:hypothetical protein
MIWKPKEKEITAEEAITLAKKELAPFWLNSAPLLAGVRTAGGVSAYPLEVLFNQQPTLILFMDPTEFAGELVFTYAREFARRYQELGIRVLLILEPVYQFLRNSKTIEPTLQRHELSIPVAIDTDGLLAKAFGVSKSPSALLINKGRTLLNHAGPSWATHLEEGIHLFLRESDPGLSLFPVFKPKQAVFVDVGRVELGRDHHATRSGVSLETRGQWTQDSECIVTADPSAQITLSVSSSKLSLIAQCFSKTTEAAKILLLVNGTPVQEAYKDEDLGFDDEGQSMIKVEEPRLYHALVNLTAKQNDITLRFPGANRASVALYGFRLMAGLEEAVSSPQGNFAIQV